MLTPKKLPEDQTQATQPLKEDEENGTQQTEYTPLATQFAETTVGATVEQETMETIAAQEAEETKKTQAVEAKVPTEWNVGDVIMDLYEVKYIHKGGGMGLVYRVHHRNWNVDLAVKSPRQHYFKTEAQKENFSRECETWVHLGLHPHIVSCYYVRRVEEIPLVFAEYVEGGSLKDWIENGKLYEGSQKKVLGQILDIAIQFAWGLQYAHEKDLIHQDVKPANVMMAPDGTVKVTDFGLANARAMTEEEIDSNSQQSILVSTGGMTPAYCSPEQANKEKLSRRTDIWSWAVSVLEMFTGEVIWRSGSVAGESFEMSYKMGKEKLRVLIPHSFADLLSWCFQENPDDRPKGMREIVVKLKEIYQQFTKEEYLRLEPGDIVPLADNLNNRAVSFLDLDKKEEAFTLWEEALQLNAQHPESVYNKSLLEWRAGIITDDEVVRRLEKVTRSNTRTGLYLGYIHLERAAADEAEEKLDWALTSPVLKKDGEAWRVLGDVRMTQEKYVEAQEAYKKAIELMPWDSVSLERLSLFQMQTHEWDSKLLFSWRRCLWCLSAFEGHTGAVTAVAVTPDNQCLVSGSEDTTLRLWILTTKVCLRTFWGHSGAVTAVTVTPDTQYIISGSTDTTLRLWRFTTRECLRVFRGHTNPVTAVAMTLDGQHVVSSSTDSTLRLWKLTTGKCLRIFRGHTNPVTAVAVTPDGQHMVSGSTDSTLRLWKLTTGKCLRIFRGHTAPVTAVAVTPDGQHVVSGSEDTTLRLWELKTGRCLRTFKGYMELITTVTITSDGRFIVSVSSNANLRLWNLDAKAQDYKAGIQVCHQRGYEALQTFFKRRFQNYLHMAKEALKSGKTSTAFKYLTQAREVPGYKRASEALALNATLARTLQRKSLHEAWLLGSFEGHKENVTAITITPDGKFIVSGSRDNTLRLWNLATGRCIQVFRGHKKAITSIKLTPDGQFIVSASEDTTLCLWHLKTAKCLRIYEGHLGSVTTAAVTPNGRFIVSGSADKTLKLWNPSTAECLWTSRKRGNGVAAVAVNPDSRFVITGYKTAMEKENTLELWELTKRKVLQTCKGHTGSVMAVAVTPDGQFMVSGGDDKILRLWNLSTGDNLRTFEGHKGNISAVAMIPGGRFAISGSADKTLKLWDLTTGECLWTFEKYTHGVTAVAVTPDGHFVVSASRDKTFYLWELDWELDIGRNVKSLEATYNVSQNHRSFLKSVRAVFSGKKQ